LRREVRVSERTNREHAPVELEDRVLAAQQRGHRARRDDRLARVVHAPSLGSSPGTDMTGR
jgi:hypothetical protein